MCVFDFYNTGAMDQCLDVDQGFGPRAACSCCEYARAVCSCCECSLCDVVCVVCVFAFLMCVFDFYFVVLCCVLCVGVLCVGVLCVVCCVCLQF